MQALQSGYKVYDQFKNISLHLDNKNHLIHTVVFSGEETINNRPFIPLGQTVYLERLRHPNITPVIDDMLLREIEEHCENLANELSETQMRYDELDECYTHLFDKHEKTIDMRLRRLWRGITFIPGALLGAAIVCITGINSNIKDLKK